ncbi:MAG TPA: glycosyltransferase family 39 protein [Actinomycetales bacterium]|nr:glycosyltransferase family 39 protein [Actinomycetales bacterium]
MPFWVAVLTLVVRALIRYDPRAWLAAGVVIGLATYNKLLIALLVLGLAAGLLIVGPRRPLRSAPAWAAVAAAVVVALPNPCLPGRQGFPQLSMASALARNKGDEARLTFLPLQLVMIGPLVVQVWVAGVVGLLRRPQWRPLRALPVAYVLICAFLLLSGGQPYYTLGLLLAFWASGCVVLESWVGTRSSRWRILAADVVVHAAVSLLLALPIVPEDRLAHTPLPTVNQVTRDSVGWPAYVHQVASVYRQVPVSERQRSVIVTGNYGEHGALHWYGRQLGLPPAYSGHNALWDLGRPPDTTATLVLVNYAGARVWLAARFQTCRVRATLDNGVRVDNEEQGQPIRICQGPRRPWPKLWRDFQHLH